jgi:hypothetical protein
MMPRMNLNTETRNETQRSGSLSGLKRDKSQTNYQKRNAQFGGGGLEIISEENRHNPLVKRRTSLEMSKEGTRKRSMIMEKK